MEDERAMKFILATLKNPHYEEDILANVILLMAELDKAELYVPQLPLLLKTSLRSVWLCRLVCQEVLHRTLYPDKHLLPLLMQAAQAGTTHVDTRVQLLQIIRHITHPTFSPPDGFADFPMGRLGPG